MTPSAVLKRCEPFGAVIAQGRRGSREAPRASAELLAVGDVEGAGALLDGAVQVRYPDLEHVEGDGLGERVHLLVDDRAAVGGGDVGHPVDREGGEVDEPERAGAAGAVSVRTASTRVAEQCRDPGPEPAARRDGVTCRASG